MNMITTDGALSSDEVVGQVQRIQQIMKSVMKEGEHYGKIPGTPKNTLFKSGAEKIMLTFRIANEIVVEDLSAFDERRYRVRSRAIHIPSGQVLGEGVGEASTNEEKYKWRKSLGQEEFDSCDIDRRREKFQVKFSKDRFAKRELEKVMQIRTNYEDLANTVLKMAKKRAQIDMVLTVTASSDIFSQDLEDLPVEVLNELVPPSYQEVPEPTKQPEKKEAVEKFECESCKKSILKNVFEFSKSRHGKALCMTCQKTPAGPNIERIVEVIDEAFPT